MKANRHVYWKRLLSCAVILSFAILGGCQHEKPRQKDDFDKWRATADSSKGFSPTQQKRSLDLQEKVEASGKTPGKAFGADLPDQLITLKMYNTDVPVLLRALAKAAVQDIVINESVGGKVNIDVEKAPWKEVFLSVLRTQGLTYERDGNILRIITIEDRNRNLQQLETEQKIKSKRREIELVDPLLTRVVKVDYADAAKLKANLEQFLTEKQEGKKLGSVMVDEHTNSLIIQAIREDLVEMLPLIQELDRPTPQILIEAHIVETSQKTARELGIRWGGLYQNPPNYFVTSGSDTGVIGVTPGNIDPVTGYAVNFPGNVVKSDAGETVLGMTLGLVARDLGGSTLAVQLSALETEGKLKILSSPSITTLDNKRAYIESGKEAPYQSVENQEVKIEYKKAVLSLEVTPHVIEGKTLKLNISTKKDELDFANSVQGNPTVITKRAETTVILYDGQTTVIGGLNKEDTNENEAGVPGLKDIPLFGWLFKGKGRNYTMDELLIFITPHILRERTPG